MNGAMGVDLDKLNPEQRAGATHLDGALLVLAGAGTGKTRVITYRIARLISLNCFQTSRDV